MRVAWILSCCLIVACVPAEPEKKTVGPPDATSDAGTEPDGQSDASPPATDYLIVATNPLLASAERFKVFREGSGLHVELALMSQVLGGQSDGASAIQSFIRQRYDRRDPARPFHVLLIGDADGKRVGDDTIVPGTYLWSEGEVRSDNVYADVDRDDIPDLAIGRIPAHTDAEVDLVRGKISGYESSYQVGLWNRRINVFSSEAGFGGYVDSMIEQLVVAILEELPYGFDVSMTYAKQSSPYVYIPEQFSDKVFERLNEGSLLMSYIGHGSENSFADLDWNSQSYPILDTSSLEPLAAQHKPTILSIIACLTGGFPSGDSLAERMLRTEGGPVAILASTEVSFPYANAVFVRELGQTLTREQPATLGQAFVRAKYRLLRQDDAMRRQIDSTVSLLMTTSQRNAEKHSHQHLYTLFGDPATLVAYPRAEATVTAPAQATPGATIDVSATFAGVGAGTARFSFETSRSAIAGALQPVPADGASDRDAVIAQNYATANEKSLAAATVSHGGGAASASLALPSSLADGTYYVKVYAEDGTIDAIGAAAVTVQQ